MEDIDFEKIARQIAGEDYIDDIDDISKILSPEMLAGFTAGRYFGRMDILLKLVGIIDEEEKNIDVFAKLLGRKNDNMEN